MGKLARIRSKPVEVDLEEAVEEFLHSRRADGVAERTLDDYRYHVEAFLKANPNITTYEALQKAVIRYFSQPCSPGYRNIRLRYLKAFFNWCVSQGYLPANPVAGIRPAKEDLNRIRHVPLEALKKLLNAPDRKTYAGLRDYCLLLVQIDTGARPGELFQVRPADLNLEARELYIRPEIAKTRVGRTLVLSPLTAQALAKFLKVRPQWWGGDVPLFATENGRPLDRGQWAARVREYCSQAGVKVTPYGLRHTFAIEFLKASNDPFALQRILGHKDLTMTRRYIRYVQDDIREAHEKASHVAKLQQLGKRANRKL
ncbi:MAG: tyrosine-type recombinase/integrase [Thermanaeromonas sp.]|uniref:tyrosine-type recombinase/integrase n=1 Tax=Thermanaeromonas sp. TaxID=2003697 RepID=UPI002440E261|nr:tyrosine-type recombinase/integrase [Thermanaeromonas sp.]MCG0278490.1 tyrosine-type recombinase/integrase [Thermanaeromonas sp.]